jgi:hypothetical protein
MRELARPAVDLLMPGADCRSGFAMKRRGTRTPVERPPRAVTAGSSDGVIVFKMVACADGLHVERSQLRASGGRVTQSMRFPDNLSFIRWCAADRLRFTYPMVYANLERSGCELFAAAP